MVSKIRLSSKRGQALSELVICLVVFVILVIGISELAQLFFARLTLRRDARAQAGERAFARSATIGDNVDLSDAPFHAINEQADLDATRLPFDSTLHMSSYTLRGHVSPNDDLGLHRTTLASTNELSVTYQNFIYRKPAIVLQESITFPSCKIIE